MTGIVSLEQARRLKEWGFPQGNFPQMIYELDEEGEPWNPRGNPLYIPSSYPSSKYHGYLAAPAGGQMPGAAGLGV